MNESNRSIEGAPTDDNNMSEAERELYALQMENKDRILTQNERDKIHELEIKIKEEEELKKQG